MHLVLVSLLTLISCSKTGDGLEGINASVNAFTNDRYSSFVCPAVIVKLVMVWMELMHQWMLSQMIGILQSFVRLPINFFIQTTPSPEPLVQI